MRGLNIDFAQRTSLVRKASIGMLLAAIVTTSHIGKTYYDLSLNLDAWKEKRRLAQADKRKAERPEAGSKEEMEKLESALKATQNVITRLALPWDALFSEIDSSVNDKVTLLSVEPDAEKKDLHIAAEAKDLTAMLDYEKRLQASALFRNVHVVSHQVQLQDPQRPVRFVIQAGWMLNASPSTTSSSSAGAGTDQ